MPAARAASRIATANTAPIAVGMPGVSMRASQRMPAERSTAAAFRTSTATVTVR